MRNLGMIFVLAVAACTTIPSALRPAFPRFSTADPSRILPTAAGSGYLVQRGRCLGLAAQPGGIPRTIIWPETARLELDGAGLLLADSVSGVRARLGDHLRVGGGVLPEGAAERLANLLTEPVPAECPGPISVVNPGFRLMS